MKRFSAMLMSLLLCVSMSACSAPAQDDDAGTAEPSTTENTQDTGGQNVLVVYYSGPETPKAWRMTSPRHWMLMCLNWNRWIPIQRKT